MFPPKSPLEQILCKNYDGIEVWSGIEKITITKSLGNRFTIEVRSRQILVDGHQLFDAIMGTFKSLSPTTEL